MNGTETGTESKPKRTRGRKDAQKQEGVTSPSVIKELVEELVNLYRAMGTASEEFSEAVKAAAEKSNYNASTIRKFVVARAGQKFEEAKKLAGQQMELFEEVGE